MASKSIMVTSNFQRLTPGTRLNCLWQLMQEMFLKLPEICWNPKLLMVKPLQEPKCKKITQSISRTCRGSSIKRERKWSLKTNLDLEVETNKCMILMSKEDSTPVLSINHKLMALDLLNNLNRYWVEGDKPWRWLSQVISKLMQTPTISIITNLDFLPKARNKYYR